MSGIELKRSLVLVGLMGCGKTSVGKRLAALLGVRFRDCDDEIVMAAGRSIADIFAEYGEAHFRDGETKVLSRLLAGAPSVIATGGGAFVSQTNRDLVRASGVSVWLTADLKVLWGRVKDKPGRPLLDTPDPFGSLRTLYEAREPAYAMADVKVESEAGEPHEAVALKILRAVAAFDLREPERAAFEREVNA